MPGQRLWLLRFSYSNIRIFLELTVWKHSQTLTIEKMKKNIRTPEKALDAWAEEDRTTSRAGKGEAGHLSCIIAKPDPLMSMLYKTKEPPLAHYRKEEQGQGGSFFCFQLYRKGDGLYLNAKSTSNQQSLCRWNKTKTKQITQGRLWVQFSTSSLGYARGHILRRLSWSNSVPLIVL